MHFSYDAKKFFNQFIHSKYFWWYIYLKSRAYFKFYCFFMNQISSADPWKIKMFVPHFRDNQIPSIWHTEYHLSQNYWCVSNYSNLKFQLSFQSSRRLTCPKNVSIGLTSTMFDKCHANRCCSDWVTNEQFIDIVLVNKFNVYKQFFSVGWSTIVEFNHQMK